MLVLARRFVPFFVPRGGIAASSSLTLGYPPSRAANVRFLRTTGNHTRQRRKGISVYIGGGVITLIVIIILLVWLF